MSSTHYARRYGLGEVVMRPSGQTFVKTQEGLVPENRHVMKLVLGRDLEPGEKAFHRDNTLLGEREHNDPKNLVLIKHRTTKWTKLIRSRIVFTPKREENRYKLVHLKSA